MRKLTEILQPFVEATEILGAEKQVTISSRNPFMNALKRHIDVEISKKTGAVKQLCKSIAEQMATRFPALPTEGEVDVTWKATALDPRYKLKGLNQLECAKIRSVLEIELVTGVESQVQQINNDARKEVLPSQSENSASTSTLNKIEKLIFDGESSSDSSNDEGKTALRIHDEIESFFKEKRALKNSCPLERWIHSQMRYPNLAILALRYMCIPATSTP